MNTDGRALTRRGRRRFSAQAFIRGKYLAGQIAILDVAERIVAIAVVAEPDSEPSIPCEASTEGCPTDDPGVANVIEPIEAILAALAEQLPLAG